MPGQNFIVDLNGCIHVMLLFYVGNVWASRWVDELRIAIATHSFCLSLSRKHATEEWMQLIYIITNH